jgi:hypothetical protein
LRGIDRKDAMGMHRVGVIGVWAGILLIAVGLIGGFTALFRDADHAAVNLLTLVPLGFATLLVGTVLCQLNRPKDGMQ